MTRNEYAAWWGVHPRTVANWERQGLVRAVRRGGVVRYVRDEFDQTKKNVPGA